jgi:hypothetical protein
MRAQLFSLVAAMAFSLGVPETVYAERYVVVNGQRLSEANIMMLERWHCGPIPNGRYWLDSNTGIWGYAGNPRPQGHIRDNCRNPGRRPSLSERGLLFSPQDWW